MEVRRKGNVQKLSLSCMTAMAVVHCVLPCLQTAAVRQYLSSDAAVTVVAILLTAGLSMLLYAILIRKQVSSPENVCKEAVPKSERFVSIDLARTTAAFLVCFVHVFLNFGYYQTPMIGKTMFALTGLRTVALLCIPLFMLITGYLGVGKVDIRKAYRSIVSFLISVLMLKAVAYLLGRRTWSVSEAINHLLMYLTDENDAWYVGMYFGMLFLMPFLNLGWERLDRKEKQTLLMALLFICGARSFSIRFFYTYWVGLYVFAYYFLGAYLREYPLLLSKPTLMALFGSAILLITVRTYVTSYQSVFEWNQFGNYSCDYNAFLVAIAGILLFFLLSQIKIRTRFGKTFLRFMGKNTLGIYLLSGAVQGRFLSGLGEKIHVSWQNLPLWILYSALTCLIAACFSEGVSLLQKGVRRLFAMKRRLPMK